MARRNTCLSGSKKSCSTSIVVTARKQAAAMLEQAESDVAPKCKRQLAAARSAFSAAQKQKGSTLQKRNAFIRATYIAGQAKSCSTVVSVGPRQGKARRRKSAGRGKE